ncbi:MAG: Rrf2 family transcriptional regulator [Candidatus Alcyoniella australis]|nr:Rrf2 family transcriptional regulator [Candidatus Alcyoniella australis]
MLITTRGQYGVMALIDLAMRERLEGGPVDLAVIANHLGLSRRYLDRIFGQLRRAGIVRGIRGTGGGYTLAMPADRIRLSNVLKVLEGPMVSVGCLGDGEHCPRSEVCVSRELWRELDSAIQKELDRHNLSELLQRHMDKVEHVASSASCCSKRGK